MDLPTNMFKVNALGNLPEILGVDDDVDGVFIGPSDLSASMGHIGNPGHPEVIAKITAALSSIREAGKAAGVLRLDPELAAVYDNAGANFNGVGVGVDTLILSQGAKALAGRFKATTKSC